MESRVLLLLLCLGVLAVTGFAKELGLEEESIAKAFLRSLQRMVLNKRQKGPGDDSFCGPTVNEQCEIGQGDCDSGWWVPGYQCRYGLECGENNCLEMNPGNGRYESDDDCCFKP